MKTQCPTPEPRLKLTGILTLPEPELRHQLEIQVRMLLPFVGPTAQPRLKLKESLTPLEPALGKLEIQGRMNMFISSLSAFAESLLKVTGCSTLLPVTAM
jgi:hypothetical protein